MPIKIFLFCAFIALISIKTKAQSGLNLLRASETLDSIYSHYAVEGTALLRENYPVSLSYKADYLGNGVVEQTNPYAYLWPFSGALSAQVAYYENTREETVLQKIENRLLPGLEQYFDKRIPYGYASYIQEAPQSDRFYDDNIWIGIDFADLYLTTKQVKYLDKAIEVWAFVESGMDSQLGGGIYWCEQRKESKNTCSNAPAVVLLLKLYEATKEKKYLDLGITLYQWTKKNLQDGEDFLYYDNINLGGKVDKRKYPYNTGQMIQAGAMLYSITKDIAYLQDAQNSALFAYSFFFEENQNEYGFRFLKKSDNWFIAVMLRGYVQLYQEDKNDVYIKCFQKNLDFAWGNMREPSGLFNKDWSGNEKTTRKWLLDQLALAEMYARMAGVGE
ncbi:glycoside hydrolase family 76 protein [Sphingobacterium wenxiniae]|uniref:Glycosyl hydrolase family 76 n=1 Tax=Sphingobacterium wenxiniae TaxID=683125 RepID=A0A1I6UC58_9SPHI|nr:glycoside hydrolase family 76 protein [Sphingobacterium wenxiniae]SFS98984.1 Glycosyl hydrolase family 76 [Sphingobacterium wenxiniae]